MGTAREITMLVKFSTKREKMLGLFNKNVEGVEEMKLLALRGSLIIVAYNSCEKNVSQKLWTEKQAQG